MRIESSTVESHRFGTARRRGYDPAEVDAVMSRVADTLAQYERMIKRLEERLENSPVSKVEIARGVAAAQDNKNKLFADARTAAAQIIDASSEEAEAIRNEASITADRIIGAAEDHLSEAQMDAQRIREEAGSLIDLAGTRAEELRAQADAILTSAIAEAERMREETEATTVAQAAEAEQMLHLAQAEANRIRAEGAEEFELARSGADAEIADVLADTRQQSEAMINSAVEEARLLRERVRAEMDEMHVSREAQAEEVVATARNEAAEIRAAAAATAEAVAAQGRVNAEDALAEARNQALDRLNEARGEAEELLNQASRETDSIVAAAREDSRRLERRTEELRTAVEEFEAHIVNLAQVAGDRTGLIKDMIDLEIKPPEAPRDDTGAPPVAPRKKGKARKTQKSSSAGIANPDGSGQLPANRDDVAHSDPWSLHASAPDEEPTELDEQFLYDGGASEQSAEAEEADAIEAAASVDADAPTTGTIYQRRGGGIKRRVAAIQSPSADDPN
ncbi:MAG: DivIVA domain-containing protein [bacterium]|nr:DivIVA domain-containing protein [bacterium]